MQKIERRALAAEQGPGRALQLAEGLTGRDRFAVAGLPADGYLITELSKYLVKPIGARKHAGFTGDHHAAHPAAGGNQLGGQVAAANIFFKRLPDLAVEGGESDWIGSHGKPYRMDL